MNRATIRRVSAGLGHYLLAEVHQALERGVVIGYDARHGSLAFAQETAAVLGALGFQIWLFDEQGPTPHLAHAVLHLSCAAGVMITASHNPPADNGYKVYWGSGAQIIPPHDQGISAHIDSIAQLGEIGVADLGMLRSEGRLRSVPEHCQRAYLESIDALRCFDGPVDLRLVYTAMHGVGRCGMERVLRRCGYTDLHMVAEQVEPDPDFPTVSFPNPEEPGALDLALALAAKVEAELLIAHDPDADRLAVAVPDDPGWRVLTGDQVGVLLGDELLRYGVQGPNRLVATTLVSSQLLARVAASYKAEFAETLTGFKWIADRALHHEGAFVMGYEEALGYACGEQVRDKDGISAGLLFCDLAARCKQQGISILDRLTKLYREHGLHLSAQRSLRLEGAKGASQIQALMEQLRSSPPKKLGQRALLELRDLLQGRALDLQTGQRSLINLPQSDVLLFRYSDGSLIRARPSGTEPKIKFYFELVRPLKSEEPLSNGEAEAQRLMKALIQDFMQHLGI